MAISYVYRDVDLEIEIGSCIIPPDSPIGNWRLYVSHWLIPLPINRVIYFNSIFVNNKLFHFMFNKGVWSSNPLNNRWLGGFIDQHKIR